MAELALFGGPQTVTVPCPPPARPLEDDAALAAIRRWLSGEDGSSLSGRGATARLEERFCRVTGRRYAVAVSSGTAGLLVCLRAVGVGPGEAVLLPSYDWPAAAAAVLALGAQPVPVDADLASGTIAPTALAARWLPGARAVVLTHLGGRPADLEPLVALARERGLRVIEDCAQALGASYRGHPVGSLGDLGAFSLGPNKLVSAGEGGVVVTDDERLYEAVVRGSQHPLYQRLRGVEPDPLHLNFRLHPCASALALPQLDQVAARLERLRANAARWRQVFRARPGFVLPGLPPGAEPSWWSFVVRYEAAAWGVPLARVLAALQAEGVPIAPAPPTRTVCTLIRRVAAPEDTCCPAADHWRRTALQLPCPDADPAEFGRFADAVACALAKVHNQRSALRALARATP